MKEDYIRRFKNLIEEKVVNRDSIVDEARFINEYGDVSLEEIQDLIDSEREDIENNLIYIEAEDSSLDIDDEGVYYPAINKIEELDFKIIHYI